MSQLTMTAAEAETQGYWTPTGALSDTTVIVGLSGAQQVWACVPGDPQPDPEPVAADTVIASVAAMSEEQKADLRAALGL